MLHGGESPSVAHFAPRAFSTPGRDAADFMLSRIAASPLHVRDESAIWRETDLLRTTMSESFRDVRTELNAQSSVVADELSRVKGELQARFDLLAAMMDEMKADRVAMRGLTEEMFTQLTAARQAKAQQQKIASESLASVKDVDAKVVRLESEMGALRRTMTDTDTEAIRWCKELQDATTKLTARVGTEETLFQLSEELQRLQATEKASETARLEGRMEELNQALVRVEVRSAEMADSLVALERNTTASLVDLRGKIGGLGDALQASRDEAYGDRQQVDQALRSLRSDALSQRDREDQLHDGLRALERIDPVSTVMLEARVMDVERRVAEALTSRLADVERRAADAATQKIAEMERRVVESYDMRCAELEARCLAAEARARAAEARATQLQSVERDVRDDQTKLAFAMSDLKRGLEQKIAHNNASVSATAESIHTLKTRLVSMLRLFNSATDREDADRILMTSEIDKFLNNLYL